VKFAVGDKVVHPRHGPGQITRIERKELLDGTKQYYTIEIPEQGLTLYVPTRKMKEVGVRPAMSQAMLSRVMDRLQSRPGQLPPDYRVRQEEVWEKLRSARSMAIAEVVRDLTWLRQADHLTKRDADYLKQGRELLAAEMALALDTEVSEAMDRIDAALASAMARAEARELRIQGAARPA
jgi:CarD family transcriptional regulator